jgi:hypothetical protein
MDPEGAFRWHCVLLALALVVGAVFVPVTSLVIGAVVIAGGMASAIAYYVPIATADRRRWRKHRDRVAAGEWLILGGLVPLAVAAALAIGWHVSLNHHAHRLAVLLVAFVGGGLAGIVISGTIDWYVILPRLAGMIGEPPCRSSLDPRWKYVTIGWYLHRALAAVATIGGATGGLVVLAIDAFGHVDEFIVGEIITVMGLIAAGYKFRLPSAAMQILNPRVHVGDAVLYRSFFESAPLEAYVVDVSLEAVKVKDVMTAAGAPEFTRKETDTVGINKIDDYLRRRPVPYAGCLHAARGVRRHQLVLQEQPETVLTPGLPARPRRSERVDRDELKPAKHRPK